MNNFFNRDAKLALPFFFLRNEDGSVDQYSSKPDYSDALKFRYSEPINILLPRYFEQGENDTIIEHLVTDNGLVKIYWPEGRDKNGNTYNLPPPDKDVKMSHPGIIKSLKTQEEK